MQYTEQTWAAISGAVVGAIIGGFLTYLGAIRISDRNRRKDANVRFYNALLTTLLLLQRDSKINTADTVENESRKKDVLVAVFEFRLHLRWLERTRFDKAWDEYQGGDIAGDYFGEMQGRDRKESCRQLAIHRINKLLLFAGYRE